MFVAFNDEARENVDPVAYATVRQKLSADLADRSLPREKLQTYFVAIALGLGVK